MPDASLGNSKGPYAADGFLIAPNVPRLRESVTVGQGRMAPSLLTVWTRTTCATRRMSSLESVAELIAVVDDRQYRLRSNSDRWKGETADRGAWDAGASGRKARAHPYSCCGAVRQVRNAPRLRSRQLHDTPHDQSSDDTQHHDAQSCGAPTVVGDASRLPLGPPPVRVHVDDERRVIRRHGARQFLFHVSSLRAGRSRRCPRVHTVGDRHVRAVTHLDSGSRPRPAAGGSMSRCAIGNSRRCRGPLQWHE